MRSLAEVAERTWTPLASSWPKHRAKLHLDQMVAKEDALKA